MTATYKLSIITLCYIIVPCLKIIKYPENTTVIPEQDTRFICSALGYGTLKYHWERKNSSLSSHSISTLEMAKFNGQNITISALKITKVQPLDEGLYCCVVSNECGSSEGCAWLQVNG